VSRLILTACLALAGCYDTNPGAHSRSTEANRLPAGATNIRDAGNGWSTFTYEGHRYLYMSRNSGANFATEALTRID
jgi:hypothetical protein